VIAEAQADGFELIERMSDSRGPSAGHAAMMTAGRVASTSARRSLPDRLRRGRVFV
jgi:hypothetical protein